MLNIERCLLSAFSFRRYLKFPVVNPFWSSVVMTWTWVSESPPKCAACGTLLRASNRYPTCFYCWRASNESWNAWFKTYDQTARGQHVGMPWPVPWRSVVNVPTPLPDPLPSIVGLLAAQMMDIEEEVTEESMEKKPKNNWGMRATNIRLGSRYRVIGRPWWI